MTSRVPIEDLRVGDLVELPTTSGVKSIRLARILPRQRGIEFVGRGAGGEWSFGREYGDSMVRLGGPGRRRSGG